MGLAEPRAVCARRRVTSSPEGPPNGLGLLTRPSLVSGSTRCWLHHGGPSSQRLGWLIDGPSMFRAGLPRTFAVSPGRATSP